jgi:hypothetical protein
MWFDAGTRRKMPHRYRPPPERHHFMLRRTIAPRPEKLAPGANDRLDFRGQVIYKRQTSGKAAGRSRFT